MSVVRPRTRRRGHGRGHLSSLGPRSFGPTRPRPAPPRWTVRSRDGVAHQHELTTLTLVVAIKTNCDGCRAFYEEVPSTPDGLEVVVVVRENVGDEQFARATRPIYEARELLDELDVRWPPFYVLLAPEPARVVTEGVAFSPEQIFDEIAHHLD